MLRDGYFDDCDALLYWHPSSNNAPMRAPSLAAISAVFRFKGLAAHAPQAHLGRSALDAVELMDVGANYLREHLPRDAYMHYAVLGNGIAPNTVPDRCAVWYHMRAPRRRELDIAFARLKKVAAGAAMMTETELESIDIVGSGNETLFSGALADLMAENMRELGGPAFTGEDYAYGREISALFTEEQLLRGAQAFCVPAEDVGSILQTNVVFDTQNAYMPASGDFDVSWFKPFGSVYCATWPIGVFTHTWQATACTGSSIGFNGMLFAAKTLAGTAYELMSEPALLQKAVDECEEARKELRYEFTIGPDSVPRRVQ